jgi:glycosyltransferase involved in cell wall biosynthesis
MSASRQFIILDQSLTNADGHHYDMDRRVAEAAAAAGFAPRVAANRAFDTSLPFDEASVDRWFSQTWVDAHQTKTVQVARRAIEALPRVLRPALLSIAGHARRMLTPKSDAVGAPPPFGAEAISYLQTRDVAAGDHVFVHTLAGAELHALCEALSVADLQTRIHIVLRRDADEPVMSKGVPGGYSALLARIAEHARLSHFIRLYTDTEALTAQHRTLEPRLAFQTLPIPIPPIATDITDAPRAPGPLRLVYLGNARSEKGFQALPSAMLALKAAGLPATELIAQANSNTSLAEDVIDDARRLLRAMDNVQLIETPLGSEDYGRLLASADLILLPYNAKDYRRRSSGILIEALAAQKPVVIPDDSWLSDTAPPDCAVAFSGYPSFGTAVVRAVQDIAALSAAARAIAPEWRSRHSPRALVQVLLDSA